jgi:hypothetical protein
MSAGLIAFVGLIYAGIAVNEFVNGRVPMSVVYAGYALANVGLFQLAR